MTVSLWIWAHVSFALVIVSVGNKATRRVIAIVVVCALIVGFVPIKGIDICGRLLPFFGSLSVGSVFVLCLKILSRLEVHNRQWTRTQQYPAAVLWGCGGTAVLAAALGFWSVDVYAVGYLPISGWFALAGSLIAVSLRHRVFGLYLVVTVIAWQLRIVESANLWDYLLDPWLTIGSYVFVVRGYLSRRSAAAVSDVASHQD